jgi:hypothetical protein
VRRKFTRYQVLRNESLTLVCKAQQRCTNGSANAALSNGYAILVEVVADQEQHDGVERSRIVRRYPKIRQGGAAAAFDH